MTELSINTPQYVLLHAKQRISAKVLPLASGQPAMAIYGFSDKQPYDTFCANSELALTPYPLVKGYLHEQITEWSDTLMLVIVDAAGPSASVVNAATMSAVVEAQENKSNSVPIAFTLMLDEPAQAYRLQEISRGSNSMSAHLSGVSNASQGPLATTRNES